MRRALVGVVLLLTTACVHAPVGGTARTITFPGVDQVTLDGFVATCQWTWVEELGEPIDDPALVACVRDAVRGQTCEELRQILRARPDYDARAKRRHYNRPPTLGLRGDLT